MKLLITTVVDHNYQAYIPLFIYCVKKAYPEYNVRVFYRGELDPGIRDITLNGSIIDGFLKRFPFNKATTSSLRFVLPDALLKNGERYYDYYFITDIDMLIYREDKSIHDQHLEVMKRAKLECYENIAVRHQKYGYRMPGVLFMTREWLKRTRAMREKFLEYLDHPNIANYYEHDEVMLYTICKESGLKITLKGTENWRHHGIHLGKWKRNKLIKLCYQHEVEFIQSLLKDRKFMNLLEVCGNLKPEIKEVFQGLRDCVDGKRF